MITTSTSLSQVAVADLRSKQPLEHPGPADHTFYFLLADEEEGASFNLVNIDEDREGCRKKNTYFLWSFAKPPLGPPPPPPGMVFLRIKKFTPIFFWKLNL